MDATFYSIAPVIATGSLKPDPGRGRPVYSSSRKRKAASEFAEQFAVVYEHGPTESPPYEATYKKPGSR